MDAFLTIVASTGTGDYSTSAPVSGGAIALGNVVLLPSTDYPTWTGHLRALDTSVVPPTLKWDAAEVLNNPTQTWQPTPAKRAIYTWDATGALVPVDTAAVDVAAMQAIAGDPALTANVVDWIRGYDGTLTNTARFSVDPLDPCNTKGWLLGPIINSTPAVVGGPYQYKQFGNVADHRPFEATYAARRPLAWVGSDDGMLHAFDFNDGTEVLALLPPNLLKTQIALYKNYVAGKPTDDNVTGQLKTIDLHIWGVANSFRFADVWFGTGYKTVGFLTEGPGGDLLAAIDITHVFPGYPTATPAVPKDPNYDSTKPVEILWTKSSADYTGLFGTWSVPALAPDSFSTSRMFFGAGINPASLIASSVDATAFVVDPSDGTLNASLTLASVSSPSPLVGQQSFADSVFFQTRASGYLPDNVADLNLQADLNGQVWFNYGTFTGSPSSTVGIDLNYASGTPTTTVTVGTETRTISTTGPQTALAPAHLLLAGRERPGHVRLPALRARERQPLRDEPDGVGLEREPDVGTPPPAPYDSSLPSFTPYLYLAVGPKKLTDATFTSVLPARQGPEPAVRPQAAHRRRGGGRDPAPARRSGALAGPPSDEARAAHAGDVLAAHGRRQHGHREGEGDLPPLRSGFRLQRHVVRRDPDLPVGFDLHRACRVVDRDARSGARRRERNHAHERQALRRQERRRPRPDRGPDGSAGAREHALRHPDVPARVVEGREVSAAGRSR